MTAGALTRAAIGWRGPKAEVIADICLVGCWLWLIRPSLRWIVVNLTHGSGRSLSLVLVSAILGLAVFRALERRRARAVPNRRRLRLRLSPRLLPTILFVAGGIAFVACERLVGVNRLSLVAAWMGSYGLAGLYLPPSAWRHGFVPGLLFLIVLPLAEQIDVYLGFPARVITADIVHQALVGLVPQDITAQTILVFENGAAQVDLPCSGVKSLWAGAVLSLAATWLDSRQLGWQWLLCNALFVGLLLAINVARVLALVVVGLALDRPAAAELMHVPLGLIGFALAAVALLVAFRLVVPRRNAADRKRWRPEPAWRLRVLLIALVAGLIAVWAPRPSPAATPDRTQLLQLPGAMITEPLPLQPLEAEHFRDQGATHVIKMRFWWRTTSGSLLVVLAETFRAHHLPDRCIAGTGLKIERRSTQLLDASRPIRRVELRDHPGDAAYWFQSPGGTTEDYSARVWADVSGAERRWVLVSVLFDEQTSDSHELLQLIVDAVDASFFGGTP